jgi:hypothetical protein
MLFLLPLFLSGLAYFKALEAFGAENITASNFEIDQTIFFLQSHLVGCAKEKNDDMFTQLIHIISRKTTDSEMGFSLPSDGLDKIIHNKIERKKSKNDPLLDKTAIYWAVENNNEYMVMNLLKLEHAFHRTEEEGRKCLQDNIGSHEHLSKWLEVYSKLYCGTQFWDSLMNALKYGLVSYTPYFMDIYSDITLANIYRSYSSGNFSMTELWSCGDTELNSSCYGRIGSDHTTSYHTDGDNLLQGFEDITSSFSVAFDITIFAMFFTICF